MNKKFLSAILFGALMVSSTGTFVSCKDYDDDIDNINKELTDIKSKLSDLESKVTTGGAYVTKIESVEGGLKVSVSDGTSYNLTIAGTPAGSTVVIDKTTGEISIDGTPTGFFATTGTTPQGESTAPYVKDGFWYFYDDATKAFVKSEYKASGNAWAVQKGDSVVLHIPNEAGVMQEITLPTSSSALTALNVVTPSNWISGKNIAWSKAGADVTWAGKKGNVTAGQLLIGQLSNLVEVAEVSPKSYDLGAQELTLVDVEGKAAPVKVVATPQDAESTAPRAVSMNGKWNLSIEMNETITADNIATAFTKKENGVDRNVKYALAVNGTVMTGYAFVIDTQTDAESKTNKALSDKSITSVVIDGKTGNTVPLGTTILAVKEDNVYDSYIKFEGLDASKAEKAGITVDGMTMTVPATAAGVQDLKATIYALDVTGHISTHTVDLNIASATEAPSESVSPVDIKIIKTGQSFTIDLGDTFANLDANQALSINKSALTTNNKDFFALTDGVLGAQNAPYEVCLANSNGIVYKNEKDEEVDLNGASKDLRSIKKAVITLGSVYKSGAESPANMFGSFTLTLTLKAGENAVKAIEIPVTVEEPAFGDLYEQNEYAAWADNTYTTTLVKGTGNKPSISLENIFVSKKDANGTAITSASVSYTKVTYTDYDGNTRDENATTLFGDLSASGVKILKDVVNGKELAVNTFKTKASAGILEIKYNTSETYNVKVTSPEFTVKAKSVFEGASLVYYKAGASVDAIVNTETDMIAPLTGAAEKRNGLALKLGDSEMAVNFANLSADNAATNQNYNVQGKLGQKFTVTKQANLNGTPASTYAIYASLDESENSFGTVTMGTPGNKYVGDTEAKKQAAQQAENNATGIKVTGLEEGQGGTLVLTFKDELDIITTATVKYKK